MLVKSWRMTGKSSSNTYWDKITIMDNSLNALSKCDEEPVAVEERDDRDVLRRG